MDGNNDLVDVYFFRFGFDVVSVVVMVMILWNDNRFCFVSGFVFGIEIIKGDVC